jgi:hypothetical protein
LEGFFRSLLALPGTLLDFQLFFEFDDQVLARPGDQQTPPPLGIAPEGRFNEDLTKDLTKAVAPG